MAAFRCFQTEVPTLKVNDQRTTDTAAALSAGPRWRRRHHDPTHVPDSLARRRRSQPDASLPPLPTHQPALLTCEVHRQIAFECYATEREMSPSRLSRTGVTRLRPMTAPFEQPAHLLL